MGTPGSSVQRASPSTPRDPAAARFTVVACTWRLASASAAGSAPITSQARRRFSRARSGSSSVSTPRLSDSNGPSLTPPSRVVKATSNGPSTSQRITRATFARSRSHSGVLRAGSVSTSSSRALSAWPTAGPSGMPSARSSSPPIARSRTRCGCLRSCVDRALHAVQRGQLPRLDLLGQRIGALVLKEAPARGRSPLRREEATGRLGVGSPCSTGKAWLGERCGRPRRAHPVSGSGAGRGTGPCEFRCGVRGGDIVAVGDRLAEVVEQEARASDLERRAQLGTPAARSRTCARRRACPGGRCPYRGRSRARTRG